MPSTQVRQAQSSRRAHDRAASLDAPVLGDAADPMLGGVPHKGDRDAIFRDPGDSSATRRRSRGEDVRPSTRPWVRKSQGLGRSYRRGDLFYGLSGARHLAMLDIRDRGDDLVSRFVHDPDAIGRAFDVAPYASEHFPGMESGGTRLSGLDYVWPVLGDAAEPMTADSMHNEFLGTGAARYQGAESLAYSAKNIRRDAPKRLRHYAKSLHASRFTPSTAPAKDMDSVMIRIRRACKYAMEYTVTRGAKVHFVLDDLTMGECGVETSRPTVLGDKYWPHEDRSMRSHTGSELRFLYRNRFREAFRKGVVFWKDGESVPPPWEDPRTAAAWSGYAPKHITLDGDWGEPVKLRHADFTKQHGEDTASWEQYALRTNADGTGFDAQRRLHAVSKLAKKRERTRLQRGVHKVAKRTRRAVRTLQRHAKRIVTR